MTKTRKQGAVDLVPVSAGHLLETALLLRETSSALLRLLELNHCAHCLDVEVLRSLPCVLHGPEQPTAAAQPLERLALCAWLPDNEQERSELGQC